MFNTTRNDEIRSKVKDVLAKAELLYGVKLNPQVLFNLKGRVAGWAGCKICRMTLSRNYFLRFNQDLINGKHFEDMRDETVPHEVAHLVCFARPELGRNHNDGWRRVCLALGGNGKTRHDYEVQHAGGTIVYISDRGHEIRISKNRHTKVQRGTSYRFKHGKGTIDRYCAWAPEGQTPVVRVKRPEPMQIAPGDINQLGRVLAGIMGVNPLVKPAPAVKPTVTQNVVPAGASKADVVRQYIRDAKRAGGNMGTAVDRAIATLGMPRAQAIRYVRENWDRA